MKRFITFILAVLVLSLSVMPCADAADSDVDGIVHVEKANKKPDNPMQDDCSPFCQCSCCAGFSVLQHASLHAVHQPETNLSYNCFDNRQLLYASFAVWQPPQLV